MAKAVRANKKSGVKTKAKAARKPVKAKTTKTAAKPAATKKTAKAKAPAKAGKPATKKTAPKKSMTGKAAVGKPAAAKRAAPKKKAAAARPAAKAPAPEPVAKARAAQKPKATPKPGAAKPKAAPQAIAPAPQKPLSPASAGNLPAIGERAPDFSLPTDDGRTVGLADFAGKKLVLYFYPKDDTPGCTIEAIAFSTQKAAFEAAGAVVVGVSKDSVADHCRFKSKHGLSIPLISDEGGKMLEDYGVWAEKNLYGRTYMGINRTTFLIDGQGIVRQVWPKVRVEGHADEVLAAVKSL